MTTRSVTGVLVRRVRIGSNRQPRVDRTVCADAAVGPVLRGGGRAGGATGVTARLRDRLGRMPTGKSASPLKVSYLQEVYQRERRRSRTYQPLGYNGLPVLKTGRIWLNEAV